MRPRQIPLLIRSRLGRQRLVVQMCQTLWPFTRLLAGAYRSTLVRGTRFVAVIGSYGKTTTARAIMAALGIPSELKPGNYRAYVAQALLRTLVSSSHGVLEVGIDDRGQMELHSRMLKPDLVVVTSIGWEHHRTFGGLEVTRSEKVKMLTRLLFSPRSCLVRPFRKCRCIYDLVIITKVSGYLITLWFL